jgi:hypothetical protein
MIEPIHADDKSEGNGDDPDGSRDDTPQPPIIRSRGFETHHCLSLCTSRPRVQPHLVDGPVWIITLNSGVLDDPEPDFVDIGVGRGLFSGKEAAAVVSRRPS